MATPAEVRSQLVYALHDELIGPNADDPRDADHLSETLVGPPSRRYLAGVLAPSAMREDEKADDANEEVTSGEDDASDGEPEAPVARRPIFPSSIGLSVLIPAATKEAQVRVTYGTYQPAAQAAEGSAEASEGHRTPWKRTPHEHLVTVTINPDEPKSSHKLGDRGAVLHTRLRDVPATELGLVAPGTRYLSLFLVNENFETTTRGEADKTFLFQVHLEATCAEPFIARPNLRGARVDDEIDERIGDLQYRDAFEYAVGHGVSAVVKIGEGGRCRKAATCWMPTALVEKVAPTEVKGVELGMAKLADLADGAALHAAVGPLVPAYRAWIEKQRGIALETSEHSETPETRKSRRETADTLLHTAGIACERIERGIAAIAKDAQALEAFKLANRAMEQAQWQRSGDGLRARNAVPSWRPFQLAFLLLNAAGIIDPTNPEREAVDLIFFPTGGGKTEAYLGLAAFTLVLRRLRNPGLTSGGMAVLMRYTLRLLTLDQLDRAATLVCALELMRRKEPAKLGPHRFSIGLWVGKSATPNRFGSKSDHDDSTARAKVLAYGRDPKKNPSPIPVDKCPWCATPFDQDTFVLKPDGSDSPTQLRVQCHEPKCAFRPTKDFSEGLPIVAVDDEIYRELPCFLIATVDKFAALPWVGKTGLLLGCDVTHHDGLGYYSSTEHPRDARKLPTPLLPPDLIIQDELHLISGPLGTMVGLYETAIEHLTTRKVGDRPIKPKIVASTATVRRAHSQIRALFGRTRVEFFPPPGPNRRDSFFAETLAATVEEPRLYVGLAAPGRSQKVLLMRTYLAVLGAAQRAFASDPQAADPYMTLLGYFNSLRELGGARRIVEDEVRSRLMRIAQRHRVGEDTTTLANRSIAFECVEITSRETTDNVKVAKERLGQRWVGTRQKDRLPVDVALASNMISVGLDISRLGLMVVNGQPKMTAEYIQASSRVGRDSARPGLVLTMFNLHKPRDRSHFEHFTAYHESFYRGVEATSVTPFSRRAIDRGLAAVTVALARLGDKRLTPPDEAKSIDAVKQDLGFIGDVLATRVEAHREGREDAEPLKDIQWMLRQRVQALLDSWVLIAKDDPGAQGLAYQLFEQGQSAKRPLLRMPIDPDLADCSEHERRFVANRSMRDVEATTDVYVASLRSSATAPKESKP